MHFITSRIVFLTKMATSSFWGVSFSRQLLLANGEMIDSGNTKAAYNSTQQSSIFLQTGRHSSDFRAGAMKWTISIEQASLSAFSATSMNLFKTKTFPHPSTRERSLNRLVTMHRKGVFSDTVLESILQT